MVKEEAPAGIPVACSEMLDVEGNVLTVFGVTLQDPCATAQERATVPANPSCEATLMFPLTLPPDFTAENDVFALSTKSGFSVTLSENDCVFAAGAPGLVA